MHQTIGDLETVTKLMQEGSAQQAATLCEQLLVQNPEDISLLLVASRAYQQLSVFDRMLSLARRASMLAPDNNDACLRHAECLLYSSDVNAALQMLAIVRARAGQDATLLTRVAEFYVHCARHRDALHCHEKAMALQPDNPAYAYNVASSCIAIGDLGRAEQLFNRVIYLKPDDYDAWQNRSTLRTQTPEDNHVEQLELVKQQMETPQAGEVPVCFALAKELEDLGRYDAAFAYLQEGSYKRRQRLSYNVADDEAVMKKIRAVFDHKIFRTGHKSFPGKRPIFVLGLPRSGTTLVDRIISSHSQVHSIGESNALAFALLRAAQTGGGISGDKLALVERSARIDFAEMGQYYHQSTDGLGADTTRLVDKTPLNFLYLGLIHLAMPGAKIIHLRRHPVDSCYAMYKTLFRMGYPFTYSLEDVGRYYIAYHRLMKHWRQLLPGVFLDVDYEKLVENQAAESRRILAYLGLEWEDACLEFYRHRGAAATASAAQVRKPIYHSSVGRWKCYRQQLTPFVARLKEHGIEVD